MKWRAGSASRESMSEGARPALKSGRLLLWGFLLLLVLLFLCRWVAVLYTDFLWYSSEGATGVFLTRIAWEWGTRLAIGAAAGIFAWPSLRAMARSFRGLQIRRRFGNLVIQEQLPESYLRWGVHLGALLFGLWFALVLPGGTGMRALLLLLGEPWGATDPFFGRDLGFYLFTLPALRSLADLALILATLLTLTAISGYFATGRLMWGKGRITIPLRGPRNHLGVLTASLAILLALRFQLSGYALLLDGSSGVQGIFGFADHHARLYVYRVLTFLSLLAAPLIVWGVRSGRSRLAAGTLGGILVGAGLLTQVVPLVVQRVRVQPNELARETPYIEEAIRFTRIGFGLDEVARAPLAPISDITPSGGDVLEAMQRLPIWTESALLTSFRQTEAGFQYYDFAQVGLGSYRIGEGGSAVPIAVAVREVNPAGIPDLDPGWQNLHMRERYVAGVGAVAAEASRRTNEGRVPVFLASIPPELRGGPPGASSLALTRPAIHIGSSFPAGSGVQRYALIDSGQGEFLSPEGAPGVPGEDFPGGVPLGSLLRKVLLALRFQDANLLLASGVDADSRMVFRRQVTERVSALAPFLLYPEPPYPVIHEGRVTWLLEGFTLSESFPLSSQHAVANGITANYLRNSVKVSVDAVTGRTHLYAADPDDPILRAFMKGFPNLFQDLEEMPVGIREHLRYPRSYLDVQSNVLARYHMENPGVFHGQQALWETATELSSGSEPVRYRPEYALLTLPGEDTPSHLLTGLFVPQGRNTLASILSARWDHESGGQLFLWDLPQDDPFQGPRQVDAMIEQDPSISEQFSLWRQGGSQVWLGHLHLVRVEGSLYYMEPVFLAADQDAIPEIHRIIVSDGERLAMEPTLEEALSVLLGDSIEVEERPEVQGGTTDALQILDLAEESLRLGRWGAFGEYLGELRELLETRMEQGSP